MQHETTSSSLGPIITFIQNQRSSGEHLKQWIVVQFQSVVYLFWLCLGGVCWERGQVVLSDEARLKTRLEERGVLLVSAIRSGSLKLEKKQG